jgi:hypothetical protein
MSGAVPTAAGLILLSILVPTLMNNPDFTMCSQKESHVSNSFFF